MQPLANKMRPKTLDDVVGQMHLIGEGKPIRNFIKNKKIPSLVLFGPTGCGKTTLARIIAESIDKPLVKLNATLAATADIKAAVSKGPIVLILDEIQNFNKKQQQVLLDYTESGMITLIAMTTENPHFYIIDALMSRAVALECKKVLATEIVPVLKKGLESENKELLSEISATDKVLLKMAELSDGDVRRAINLLETTILTNFSAEKLELTEEMIYSVKGVHSLSENEHFELMSCLQKSIRGSDPDAAIVYLARLLSTGDIQAACRRLTVIASEDVGLANPNAITVVNSCVDAALRLGMPEARIPLSQATIFLATCPKSNSAYLAYKKAEEAISQNGLGEMPAFIKNPKTYLYPHAFKYNWVKQNYMPTNLNSEQFYIPQENKLEALANEYWKNIKNK